MGEMRDRRLRGERYRATDPEDHAAYERVQEGLRRFNDEPDAVARTALLTALLEHVGEDVEVRPRLFCEYGAITIGAGTFVNVDAVMLDVASITIGRDCQLAPRVQLLTATHPLDPVARRQGWESGAPIVLEDNVWLGAGAIVCPGVRIGQDTVVGAGAVVTADLPSGVLAVGVPARIVKELQPG